jgi:hypothetical protein
VAVVDVDVAGVLGGVFGNDDRRHKIEKQKGADTCNQRDHSDDAHEGWVDAKIFGDAPANAGKDRIGASIKMLWRAHRFL